MPATPLPVTDRFFAADITKVYFLETIANVNMTPTRAEITAGTDLSDEIADWSGWSVTSGTIDTPDLGSRFTSQIGGRTSAPGSSITFYGDRGGDDVRQVLPRGTTGFIVIADGGDVATQPADVFPVTVLSVGKMRSVGDAAFQLTINFSITREPKEDATLPALSGGGG